MKPFLALFLLAAPTHSLEACATHADCPATAYCDELNFCSQGELPKIRLGCPDGQIDCKGVCQPIIKACDNIEEVQE